MGSRGPVPKRSEARTRRNKENSAGIPLRKGIAEPVVWRKPDPSWDPAVKRFYGSFKKSGFAAYVQQTDIDWAWLACDEMNDYRQSGNKSAMKLQAVLSMFSQGLGITEGDRRKMAVELDQPEEPEEDELAKKRRELQSMAKMKAPQSPGATGSG